jgi:hypothetical protein
MIIRSILWACYKVFPDCVDTVMAALVAAIHAFLAADKAWMAGIKPAMTKTRFSLIGKRSLTLWSYAACAG